jgi:hypothetical protein
MSVVDNFRIERAWSGESELSFPKCHGEELSTLAPRAVPNGLQGIHLVHRNRPEDIGDMPERVKPLFRVL